MTFGNKSRKYWIIPQASLSPDDLVLGSILKTPNDPIDILNRRAVEAVDPLHVIKEREQLTKSLSSALDSGFGSALSASSILATVLGLSPTLEGNWSKGASDAIEATNVRAQHFIPPEDYVNKALRTPEVDAFARQSFFSAPIYMVVGVAVASTLSRKEDVSSARGGKTGIALGPPGTGIEVSAELSANREHKSGYQDSVGEEVVLAYRVRRFRYSRRQDKFVKKGEDETKHARYAADEEESEDEEDEESNEIAVFSYFDDEDVATDSTGLLGFGEIGDSDDDSDSEFED